MPGLSWKDRPEGTGRVPSFLAKINGLLVLAGCTIRNDPGADIVLKIRGQIQMQSYIDRNDWYFFYET